MIGNLHQPLRVDYFVSGFFFFNSSRFMGVNRRSRRSLETIGERPTGRGEGRDWRDADGRGAQRSS